jgi:hypothetical protein
LHRPVELAGLSQSGPNRDSAQIRKKITVVNS